MSTIDELRQAIEQIEKGGPVSIEYGASDDYGEQELAFEEGFARGKGKVNEGDEESRAFSKIACIVSRAEKSTKQLRERLIRDGFDPVIVEGALERACRCGLVDDARYAEWLVRCRVRQGRGLSGVQRELAEIGFTLDDIRGWPEEFDYEDNEIERALAFLDTHPPRSKNPRASAYRKLASKGFSSECASSAARIWCERNDTVSYG